MKTSKLAYPPRGVLSSPGTYNYADHARFHSFRIAVVAKKQIHGRRRIIGNPDTTPITGNIPVSAIFADTSDRDAMAVAATVPNQLEMDRQRVGFLLLDEQQHGAAGQGIAGACK
jgi:hypothetical protein